MGGPDEKDEVAITSFSEEWINPEKCFGLDQTQGFFVRSLVRDLLEQTSPVDEAIRLSQGVRDELRSTNAKRFFDFWLGIRCARNDWKLLLFSFCECVKEFPCLVDRK